MWNVIMVEGNVTKLLDGLSVEDNDDLCDFTLADQNEVVAAKGITPSTPSDYTPITKSTVTYIVLAILINEDDEFLMMQEAKSSCAGQWYLPAGRIEPGENILEGVKREVLEETGLEMEPTTLLGVECASKAWFRFVMTGNVVGGRLKTPADADSESLQAKWIKNISEVNLRANDIFPIIERGVAYHQYLKTLQTAPASSPIWHPNVLPVVREHKKLLLRLVVCVKQKSSNKIHVLVSEKTEAHLPLCEINHMKNLHSTLRKFMVEIFGADVPAHKPHGILNVEHDGKPTGKHDGFCMTILVSFRVPLEEVYPIDKYSWVAVSKDIGERLISRLPRNLTVPLNVIR
ncbi:8-oxo-dGDP phosphatase NUDT18 isoform X2 [Planococcus citri]|uniref:8-oxo-dGDP phosphatase NUDT18 isoform X2 n=1 Tax=Planococcus citri TaxID=170843 RepID=UPI0031F847B2